MNKKKRQFKVMYESRPKVLFGSDVGCMSFSRQDD
jgi:hypothetical protein